MLHSSHLPLDSFKPLTNEDKLYVYFGGKLPLKYFLSAKILLNLTFIYRQTQQTQGFSLVAIACLYAYKLSCCKAVSLSNLMLIGMSLSMEMDNLYNLLCKWMCPYHGLCFFRQAWLPHCTSCTSWCKLGLGIHLHPKSPAIVYSLS